jgi:hypothetical protein
MQPWIASSFPEQHGGSRRRQAALIALPVSGGLRNMVVAVVFDASPETEPCLSGFPMLT